MSIRILRFLLVAGFATAWLQAQLQHLPSTCGGGIYDRANDRMVYPNGMSTGLFDGMSWQYITSPSPVPFAPFGAYDEHRGRAISFTNTTWGTVDTWEWDGANWRVVAPPTFELWPGWFRPWVVYHPERRRVMLIAPGGTGGIMLREWDGNSWNWIPTTGAPLTRPSVFGWYTYHGCVYDARRGKLVLYGRTERLNAGNHVATLPLLWEWDAASGWTAMGPSGSIGGGLRLWFDEHRGRVMCYTILSAPPRSEISLRDDSGAWSLVMTGPSPGIFSGGGYDPVRNRSYLWLSSGNGYFTDLHPAEYTPHATGCAAGISPSIRLTRTWTRPWLGETASVDVHPCPSSFAALATGFSDQLFGATPLPIDLTAYGMPGCQLRVAPEHLMLGAGAGGTVRFQFPVPNAPGLVGIEFWQQAFAFAPGANPAELLPSDSMRGRIGKSH